MRDVDPDRRIEQSTGKMGRRTHSGRTVLHLRLVRLHLSDKFLQIAGREILASKKYHRLHDNKRHRRKIRRGVVERLLIESLVRRERSAVTENKLVSVRCRLRHSGNAVHPTCTTNVLYYHLRAQNFR